jgi:hypothetical protein
MAEILPNQPIILDEETDCWLEDSGLKVLAEYGDITQFQMALSPCGSDVETVQDGNFPDATNWTLGADWSISGGQLCHSIGVFGTTTQAAPISDGVLVRMRFTLDISSGSGCLITYGAYIESFTLSGTYERWIVADGAAIFSVSANGSSVMCLSNLQVITINTNFEVVITDDEITPLTVLDTSDGYFNFEDGYFTASIDWETLALGDGCFYLFVVDPCPCSQRDIIALDFVTGTFNWSLASSWSILGGTATYNGSSSGQALLDHVLCDGTEYEVAYTLSNMGANEEFNVRLGTANGTTRTADGTYTDTITSNGTSFIMIGNSTSGTQTFDVTDMSIITSGSDTITVQSNLINVSEEFDCKTLALALCNDSDGLGFGFANTGFRPLMRIPASLNRSSYPMERLGYEYSTGRKATYYARVRKALELGFDGKVFMHDFASLFGAADHFYIDDVEHYVEDDEYPSISWSEGDDSGGVTIQVSVKTQLVENKRVSSASVGCEPGGSPLLDNTGTQITDQEDSPITTP